MKTKKYLYFVLTVVAFSAIFAACKGKSNSPEDRTTQKCWEITWKDSSSGASETNYYWETELQAQERVKTLEMMDQVSATYKEASASDEDSCKDLNKSLAL